MGFFLLCAIIKIYKIRSITDARASNIPYIRHRLQNIESFMRIMIVEDNELMRKEIINSVHKNDDVIMECPDAESALENCIDFNPDWLLLDIRLGRMNGLIAAEKIKELMPKANIAFVTSYDTEVYKKAAKALGIKHYFLKNDLLKIRDIIHRNNVTE